MLRKSKDLRLLKPTDLAPKRIHTRKPELDYLTAAGRNWAIASALRGGKEGIMNLMKDDNPIFRARASEYNPPYQDRIMRQAHQRKLTPSISIERDDGTPIVGNW